MISGKFSRLLQALEMRRALALKDIKVAETQALAQAQDAEQRLRGHREALVHYDRRVRDLLQQLDDRTFLQVAGLRAAGWGDQRPCPQRTGSLQLSLGLRNLSSWPPQRLLGL